MNEGEDRFVKDGYFSVSADRKLKGTLSLSGRSSVLHLWSDELFDVDLSEGNIITGVLENQKKVSLIGCVEVGKGQVFGISGVSQHYKFFPHYVIIGDRYFSLSEKVISEISIVMDDASSLFYDRFSFGTNIVKSSDLETLSSLDMFNNISFHKGSVIAYYTGKKEIFSVNTVIGRVSAYNEVSVSLGRQEDSHINNKILVGLKFPKPVDIAEMYQRVQKVLRFFEIIAGRPQNLLEVNIEDMDQGRPSSSAVYINMQSNRDGGTENREPGFLDILVDAIVDRDKFEELICAWLERDKMWGTARGSFSTAWAKQSRYGPDRLVGTANMFDLLPKEALPEAMPLPSDLDAALKESVKRFKQLPLSPGRESVLNAFGWARQPTLKQKIQHRSEFVTTVIGEYLPDIDLVTDAAVDLRNFYVHGSELSQKKKKLPEFQIFLVNTLEFVFCVSDLVELGWDIRAWCGKAKPAGHPFWTYLHAYRENLSKLKGQVK